MPAGKAEYIEGSKEQRDALLHGHLLSSEEASNSFNIFSSQVRATGQPSTWQLCAADSLTRLQSLNSLRQSQPMYVCLEAVCNYGGFCPPSLRSQASACPSLESISSSAVTATSNS
eukprot:scaffold18651_cov14-Tisochrysis_lutea.AAC.2